MDFDSFFRFFTIGLLIAMFSISGYFRSKADKEGGPLKPSGTPLLIILRLGAVLVLIPFVGNLINLEWFSWSRMDGPIWLRWIGALMSLSMLPLIYWLFSTIGKNISPTHATRSDHQLITSGPYRFIRHPLYTFGFLAYLGIALMNISWWLLVGLLIMMLPLIYRTPKEEENLIESFGEDYKEYVSKTGRYWPNLFR